MEGADREPCTHLSTGRFVLSVDLSRHDVPAVDSPSEPSIRVRCLRARVRLAVSSASFPVPSRVFYFERKVPMEKKWPDGPMPGPVPSRPRYSTEVRVSLAAAADGLGEMVWIAVWQGPDGSSVRGDQMNEPGLIAAAMPGFDGRSGDDLTAGCQRGGFGRTGGQFYRPEEGA
jgi:hypothetical protein